MSDPAAVLNPDAWLSAQLDRPCFHASPSWSQPLASALAELPPGGFADTKIPCEQVAVAQAFQAAGFQLVDTSVTFERRCPLPAPSLPIREATPDDAPAVARVAAESFRFSRFHLDPRFTSAEAAAVKAAWVANFFTGNRGTRLYVADVGSAIAGFLLAIHQGDRAVIDLIAVSPRHQRQGVAAALIAALAAGSDKAATLVAGTQVANVPSVRLYESLGFRLAKSAYVLHYHA
jgi:ribosomal protein S18 acetylase RimI-like enzyme